MCTTRPRRCSRRGNLACWTRLACCWLVLVALAGPAPAAAGSSLTLDRARFVLTDDPQPPADQAAWTEVTLPDNWSARIRNVAGTGWYRMTFDLDAVPDDGLAILVRRLSMNGEFYVNGARVLSGGRMDAPVTRRWNTPFFVEIAKPLLHADRNVLDIRLHAFRNNNGGLGRVEIGDPATLRAEHAFVDAVHVKGAILSFAVALVAAFIGIVAWLRMGRQTLYGLFGLAMVAWAVRYANYFIQDVSINSTAYAVVVNSAQGWFFIFFTHFLLRLSGRHWPRVEAVFYSMGIVGTLAIWAAFQGWMPLWLVVAGWSFVWLPGCAAMLLVSARTVARWPRSIVAWLVLGVAWLYVPLTFRELLITTNAVDFDTSYIAHYVGIPLAVLISWMLIDRLVAAGRAAAEAELANARAVFDERMRITQDMHDGLGLQLNAALRVVERGDLDAQKFAALLRGCLDELRLVVDSAASVSGEFLPLLASLRIRLQPKLEAIGIRLHWQMQQFPDGLVLPPGMAMQILRIVQETVNNTLKHAQASVITFQVVGSTRPGHVALVVGDNGIGFAQDAITPGRGLSGMRRRAAGAGVDVVVQSSATPPTGTSVRIDIPDRPPASTQPGTAASSEHRSGGPPF
uniref:Signal transduction histidine kinase n=1 Tax=uncultured bacterium EC5 TaxID=672206 RepID=G4WV88_9BACT|nr:signal transduction histidine kinase [uncultured bacterium EC5]